MIQRSNILLALFRAVSRAGGACNLRWLIVLALTFAAAGCRVVQTTAELPGKAASTVNRLGKDKNQQALDPVELQQDLLRFADEFSTRAMLATQELRRGTNAAEPAEVLRWKVTLGTQISAIASGPNPVANVLDMTVFVTGTRLALERYWQPKVFGPSIQPMIEVCRSAEADIWRAADRVLSPQQHQELRESIEVWYRKNPIPEAVVAARAIEFASRVQSGGTSPKSGSVFDLLKLDPLSGLDPATREIAQTRLFAERALYVAHRTPQLVRLQAELMAVDTARLPAVEQLLTNSTQVASSVERFAGIAERLPRQVSVERAEILKAFESQEKDLRLLASEVRQTLEAGSQMSTALNATLTTFNALMKRFGVGETNPAAASKPAAEPFRIQDYTQTAVQLEATAGKLTELLRVLDGTMGSTNCAQLTTQAAELVHQAQLSSQELIDYAFRRGVALLLLVFLAAILYRLLTGRLRNLSSNSHT